MLRSLASPHLDAVPMFVDASRLGHPAGAVSTGRRSQRSPQTDDAS
jgi:hypothetical protein